MAHKEESVSLEEMDQRVQRWLDNGGREELVEIGKKARAAADAVLRDAYVEPERLRRPVTI